MNKPTLPAYKPTLPAYGIAVLACVLLLFAGEACAQHPPTEIRAKAQRVKAGVQQWKLEGKNLMPVAGIMQEVRPLLEAGKFDEADALLDEALAVLAGTKIPEPRTYDSAAAMTPVSEKSFRPLVIQGETSGQAVEGMYDPSIAYDSEGRVGWMAYSKVTAPGSVDTHLAVSRNHGESWTFVKALNVSEYTTIEPDGKKIEGVWRSEVATIVHDPGDPGREWKVFWHNYFTRKPYRGGSRMFRYGWIGYRYASDPAGAWSEPIALLRGKLPRESEFKVRTSLTELDRELEDVPTYTEPGAMVHNGVLYLCMSVGGHDKSGNILIASSDHGRTWEFRGFLTTTQDAKDLGAVRITAGDPVSAGERVFLLLTPAAPFHGMKAYQGVLIAEIEDLSTGKLKRDADGRIVFANRVGRDGTDVVHWGVGAYDPKNAVGGLIVGQLRPVGGKPMFGLYDTGINIP